MRIRKKVVLTAYYLWIILFWVIRMLFLILTFNCLSKPRIGVLAGRGGALDIVMYRVLDPDVASIHESHFPLSN
mgnify:FL=1